MDRRCGCTWDPAYHRDLNIKRGKADQGDACTNSIPGDAYMQQGGVCLACVFGCAP
jgi:hypothetical protein